MSDLNTALSAMSREDLLDLLTVALTERAKVTQAPTPTEEPEPKADTRPVCGRTKSSDGEPCTRKATQEDGACKSHTGDWDNAEAKAKAAKAEEFIESRKAAHKGGGKANNKALAAAIRALGAQPNGEVWAKAKAALATGVSIEEAALAGATA